MTPERQAASPTGFSPGRLIGGGRLTAGFGFSQGRLHPGLVVESETMNRPAEVRTPVSGTVEFAGGGLGSVAVRDGRAYLHQLVYLESIRAKPGQVVRAGEVVGAAAKVYYQVTDPAGIPLDPVTQCRYVPAPSAATGHAAGAPSPSAVGSASSAAPVGAFAAATGHAAGVSAAAGVSSGPAPGAAGPAAVGSASWDGPSDDVPDDDLPDDDVGDPPGDSGGASSLGGGGSQPGGSPDPPPGPGLPGPEPPEDDEPPEEEEEEEREDEEEDQESEEQASSAQGTGGPATGSSKGSPSACANRLDGLEAMAKTIEGSGPGPGSGSIQARRATGAAARVLASRLQLVATTATEAESLGEELLARLKARTAETYAAKAAALTAYIAHARTVGAGAQTLVGRAVALASRMEGN